MLNQNSLFLILAAPACSWVVGMGLFKALLVMVLMHHYLPHGQFAGPLGQLFSTPWFFYFIIVMGIIEFIVDFIPRVDLSWGRWTAHLRIAAAGILPWYILTNEDVMSRITMAIVGMVLAITCITALSSARRASTRAGTQGFVSPIASTTENCMIAATLAPLTKLPPMTLLMLAFMMGASLIIIYVVRRDARDTFAWLFGLRWVRPEITDTSGEHA